MRRLLILLLMLSIPRAGLAAAPLEATLGVPLEVRIPLPAADLELPGLPDLAPFVLLAPPVQTHGQLVLQLLPLHPGDQGLPPLSLQQGARHWLTPPLSIKVVEGLAEDTTAAPLRSYPAAETTSDTPWFWLIPTLLLLTLAGCYRRNRANTSPAPDPLSCLQRQLEELPCGPQRDTLLRNLHGWRFGPHPPDDRTLAALQQQALALSGDGS